MREYLAIDTLTAKNYTDNIRNIYMQVHETLQNSWEKYEAMHDQHKKQKLETKYGYNWTRRGYRGYVIKPRFLRYDPFEILEKVGNSAHRLTLLLYMCIYLVVSVEYQKLYEPSMLDQEEEHVLHSMEDLTQDSQEELIKDTIFQKRPKTTRNATWNLADWVDRENSKQR